VFARQVTDVVAKPRTGELLMAVRWPTNALKIVLVLWRMKGWLTAVGLGAWRPTIQNFDKSEVGLPRSNY